MELDADAQVKLTKISVSGNDRTRLSYFAAELEDLSRTGVSLKD
jgi:ribosomal protein L6P/L9E